MLKIQGGKLETIARDDVEEIKTAGLADARGPGEAAHTAGAGRPVRVPLPRQAPDRPDRQAPAGSRWRLSAGAAEAEDKGKDCSSADIIERGDIVRTGRWYLREIATRSPARIPRLNREQELVTLTVRFWAKMPLCIVDLISLPSFFRQEARTTEPASSSSREYRKRTFDGEVGGLTGRLWPVIIDAFS